MLNKVSHKSKKNKKTNVVEKLIFIVVVTLCLIISLFTLFFNQKEQKIKDIDRNNVVVESSPSASPIFLPMPVDQGDAGYVDNFDIRLQSNEIEIMESNERKLFITDIVSVFNNDTQAHQISYGSNKKKYTIRANEMLLISLEPGDSNFILSDTTIGRSTTLNVYEQ